MHNSVSSPPVFVLGRPYHRPPFAAAAYKHPALSQHPHYPSVPSANSSECYLRQQPAIEVIQLVEVPPPSRPEHLSVPGSSSAASSSYASESSSEHESAESYCSSLEDLNLNLNLDVQFRSSSEEDEPEQPRIDDTFHARMRRIEQWRDAYAKAVGAELGSSLFLLFSVLLPSFPSADFISR